MIRRPKDLKESAAVAEKRKKRRLRSQVRSKMGADRKAFRSGLRRGCSDSGLNFEGKPMRRSGAQDFAGRAETSRLTSQDRIDHLGSATWRPVGLRNGRKNIAKVGNDIHLLVLKLDDTGSLAQKPRLKKPGGG